MFPNSDLDRYAKVQDALNNVLLCLLVSLFRFGLIALLCPLERLCVSIICTFTLRM